ncbi:hypothetical protein PCC7424_3402 [Gloeothece citriformis PCC 7424]|uniref:Uncharacterized protein n=1 Tax=Gloeothece citriformis (strain PCC 7424) TaxID=65393 RepID=B7KF81_GLOC7|nr:hypothetical protein [Gloeothece citriformis]ACK71797.1 hypothetical protein PCC7424_3402 [Gloeothece citriformis PCC 7424]
MSTFSTSLTANLIQQQTNYRRWHRHQSKCQILRSQLGFNQVVSSRPAVCQGCSHYHGKAYGQSRTTRTRLICGFHPYGWTANDNCPDWQEKY